MIPPACALGLRHLLASAGCRLLPSSAPAWRACLALCSDNLPRAPFGQRGSHAEVRKERLLSSLGRAQREELWVAHACDPPLTERKYGQPARPHRVLRRGPGSADPKTMLSGRGAARAHASRVTAAVAPVASTAALPPRGSRLLKASADPTLEEGALACGPMSVRIHNEPASPPHESLPRWKGRAVPVIRLRGYQTCGASWGACGPEVVGPRPACRFAT